MHKAVMEPFDQNSSSASVGDEPLDGGHVLPPWRVEGAAAELRVVLERVSRRPVTWGELVEGMGDRAELLVIILFNLPFVIGLALPGMSVPLGFLIALTGLNLSLGRRLWLPVRVLRARVSPRTAGRALRGAERCLRWFEKFLRARWFGVVGGHRRRWVHGLPLAVLGLFLALPLPVPFTNFIPAVGVLLLALGLLERDGRTLVLGHLAFWVNVGVFGSIGWGLISSAGWVEGMVRGG